MMNTQNSSIVSSWKYLFVVPLFLFSISCLNTTIEINTGSASTESEWKQSPEQGQNYANTSEQESENEAHIAESNDNITYGGESSSRNLVLPSIEKIGMAIHANVYVRQGSKQEVRVEGPEELLQNLSTKMDGTNWDIEYKEGFKEGYKNGTKANISGSIIVYVTIKHLTHLAISGTGNITTMNRFKNLNDLNLAISGTGSIKIMADAKYIGSALSGSGNIDADITANMCKTVVSGSGNVILRGSVPNSEFVSSGSGKLGGLNFRTKECKILANGSSVVSADISDYLDVNAEGGALVRYKGSPQIKMKVSQSSQLQHVQ